MPETEYNDLRWVYGKAQYEQINKVTQTGARKGHTNWRSIYFVSSLFVSESCKTEPNPRWTPAKNVVWRPEYKHV